jgi:hypothetical protein
MVAIAAVLPRLIQLRRLDCSHNPIGKAGWVALGATLVQLPALTALGLSNCEFMGDAGATALADGLLVAAHADQLVPLIQLLCSACSIGDAGAWALASALPRCPLLEDLDLAGYSDTLQGHSSAAHAKGMLPSGSNMYGETAKVALDAAALEQGGRVKIRHLRSEWRLRARRKAHEEAAMVQATIEAEVAWAQTLPQGRCLDSDVATASTAGKTAALAESVP